MITWGKFQQEAIPKAEESPIKCLRIIFKKSQIDDALKYCASVKEKGYKLFINPTFIDQYSGNELQALLKRIEIILAGVIRLKNVRLARVGKVGVFLMGGENGVSQSK